MEKRNAKALLPIAVFVVLYLGLGILFEYGLNIEMGFYKIPVVIIFLLALLVACLQNRKLSLNDKLRRDLSRVLSAKCNRFAYTYNRQGFLCKFSLLTLLMIATEPIPVPEELRQVQAHQGGLDEVVSGEIRCGYRPPPAGADAGQALGQGYGAVRDFPFPAASGKMKSVLRAAPRWDKVSQSRGHDRPTQLLDTLSSQRIENG